VKQLKRGLRVKKIVRFVVLVGCVVGLWTMRAVAQEHAGAWHAAQVQFVAVEPEVKLEVLDWGGTGRPLVLLAGMGDTAHAFDGFARKLAAKYHVYGITRRGFGASSRPEFVTANYSATRLGEDVVAVMAALKLERPVVAGHSFAGEELSYLGAHHAELVAGLIYLDAGYAYALYDEANGQIMLDAIRLQGMLPQIVPGRIPADAPKSLNEILAQMKVVEKEITEYLSQLPPTPAAAEPRPDPPPYLYALFSGQESFRTIDAPALVIFAVPHDFGPSDHSAAREQMEAKDLRVTERQVKAFETQVPSARVVRMPHASHYVYRSIEAQVLQEMDACVAGLR